MNLTFAATRLGTCWASSWYRKTRCASPSAETYRPQNGPIGGFLARLATGVPVSALP